MLGAFQVQVPAGPLVPAVAASLVLHVAVLMGVPDLAQYAQEAPRAPLNARLTVPDAPPAAQPAAEAPPTLPPGPAKAAAAPPQRERAQPRAQPERSAARVPVPAPEPIAPIVPAPVAIADPAPAAPAASASSQPAGGAGEPSSVPRSAPDAVELGSLAQYRLALIGTAKRHKLYPAYAIERGWQGRVSVELAIAPDGTLAAASIKRSSGHEVLDREAMEMLRKAVALTPVPPALRSREFRIDVPVLFELANS